MAQRNIDFGTFPDDPDADAIRTAFQKVQENFNELFSGLEDQAVISVNRTPGAGISVNSPTGNVIVSANIACVTVTSNTLSVGTGSNNSGIAGGTALIVNSTQTIVVDLPYDVANIDNITVNETFTGVNANLSGNLIASNANIGSLLGGNANITGTLNVTGNANVGNLGATTGIFTANVSVSNNLTAANVYANTGVVSAATGTFSGNISAGNANLGNLATANYFVGNGAGLTGVVAVPGSVILSASTEVNIPSPNSSIFMSVAGTPNVLVVGQTGVNVAGYLSTTGNLTAANANLGNSVSANYFVGNFYGAANTATSATTAGTVTTAAQPNITSVGTLTSLIVSGNVSAGNVNGTSGAFTYVNGNGANLTSLTGANVTGQVPFAAVANSVAGGNVSGQVNFAAVANSVAGANVSGTVSNATTATTAGTVTTNAQPNITSVGTLTSLSVSGNISAGNVSATNGVFTNVSGNGANLTSLPGANVSGAVANASHASTANAVVNASQPNITNVGTLTSLTVSGNVTSGNVYANSGTIGASLLTGTLTTGSQPNVTSVGTLTSLSVTGNVTSGNVYANSGVVKAQYLIGDGSNLTNISVGAGSYIENGNSEVRVDANSNVRITVAGVTNRLVVTSTGANINGYANVTGNLSAGNVSATGITGITLTGALTTGSQPNITNVGTLSGLTVNGTSNLGPNSNIIITGGSNNQFLLSDGAGGVKWITPANITVAPGSNTQVLFNDNGSLNAVSGLTFNKTTNGLTVSGNANVGNIGAAAGAFTTVAGSLTTASQPNITTVGTLTGLGVNGNITAANITANSGVFTGNGSGLTNISGANVTGTVATATSATTAGTVTTNAQPNITSVGTLGNLIVSSNINANNLTGTHFGNGSGLTNIPGANVTGTVANATYATSAGSATTAGTVTTNAQPNITSVGTLSSLSVSGNLTAGNVTGANLVSANFITGTLTTSAQPNITSVGSLSSLIVLGNINTGNIAGGNLVSANFFSGNANSLFSIQGANVTGTVANATYATSAGSATTAGTVTNAAQANITSVGTLTGLSVNGNITAVNITANTGVFTGNGRGLSAIAGANVTGTVPSAIAATNASALLQNTSISTTVYPTFTTSSANGNSQAVFNTSISANLGNSSITATTFVGALSGAATTAGTVTTAAQPNITSVGTLTSLTSSGNISAANVSATGYHIRSVTTGISAAGTVQSNATALTTEINVVSTVASGAGVRLPTAVAGMVLTITNTSANSLLVYPNTSAAINSLSANSSFTQPANATLQFIAPTATQWYTVGATYA